MTSQINDIVKVFNAFRDNDNFYQEIIKESLNAKNYDEAKRITKARNEFQNNYRISDETTELIKVNIEKYIKIINTLEKKDNFITSNDTYNIEINREQIDNNNEKNTPPISNNNQENKRTDNQIDDNNVINDTNYTFSSKIAKNYLEDELERITKQINIIKNNINNSPKLPSKKEYENLFQLESYRDKLKNKIENINLDESYNNSNKIIKQDQRLNNIDDKIKEKKSLINSNISKFKKNRISKRIEKLKVLQGKIESKQRIVVNKDLLKYYKESYKNSKSDSKNDAIDKYYQDKLDLLKEKKGEILDKIDNNNYNIFTSLKNKFIKYRSWPTSIRISYIEGLQKSENLQNIKGKINGFNHLNKDITNKLYPIKQNIKEKIDLLKQQKSNLINKKGMQEVINNLNQNIPKLEATSSMIRH